MPDITFDSISESMRERSLKRLFSIRRTTLRRDQDGVAAVEFAVIAAVFFAVLFGIMEMGWLLWTEQLPRPREQPASQ